MKTLTRGVADLFDLSLELLSAPGRYPGLVQARSALCYLSVRELGKTASDLAKQMGLTQLAITISVKRDERIAKEKKLDIEALLN